MALLSVAATSVWVIVNITGCVVAENVSLRIVNCYETGEADAEIADASRADYRFLSFRTIRGVA